jgi:hypothetical protein
MARMAHRAQAVLTPVDGGRLDVEPPREIDAAAKRDGLRSPRRPDGSEVPAGRKMLLRAVAQMAPLDAWTSASGLRPAELIVAARASDWSETLESGWLDAAIIQRDAEWALALHCSPARGRGKHNDYASALKVLPPPERERLALEADPADLPTLLRLVWLCDAPFSPELTRALAGPLLASLPTVKPRGGEPRELLLAVTSRGAPSLYPELVAQVAARLPDDPASAAMVERAMRRLELRHNLHQEHAP